MKLTFYLEPEDLELYLEPHDLEKSTADRRIKYARTRGVRDRLSPMELNLSGPDDLEAV